MNLFVSLLALVFQLTISSSKAIDVLNLRSNISLNSTMAEQGDTLLVQESPELSILRALLISQIE